MSTGPLPRVTAGRRENAATEGSGRRLTGPRREVLAALEACGPANAEAVAVCWRSRQSTDAAYLGDGLPDMVSRLLWKLEALAWVEPVEGGFAITESGVAALHDTRSAGP